MSRAGALAPAVYDARPGPVNYSVRVVRFAVVREATESVPRTLSTPEAVATLARELIPDDAREHFGVFLLNARNGLIAYHEVSTGTLSASLVHPREVFGPALRVMGVASLILVHNHPSGDPEPSRKTFGSPGSWSTRARSSTCRSTITSSSATAATPTCRSPAAGSSEAPPVRRPDQTPNRREPGALSGPIRAALYARVSTTDQTPDNQLVALRSFAEARGWTVTEFVDHRISGAKDRRPGLDALLAAVRTRKVDVVACIKLDRLARSTRHLVTLTADLEALGVDLIVLDQSIDTTTPSGRLLFHVLAAIAEFERDLIRDRVVTGLRRAKAQGRHLGRPRRYHVDGAEAQALAAAGLSLRGIGRRLNAHPMAVRRALAGA